jgi:hypothetical protein
MANSMANSRADSMANSRADSMADSMANSRADSKQLALGAFATLLSLHQDLVIVD